MKLETFETNGPVLRHPSSPPKESPKGAPDEAFTRAAVPLVRQFVTARYKDYGKGKAAWILRTCLLLFGGGDGEGDFW